MNRSLTDNLEHFLNRLLPRILTQISRDPGSATHGCCDRNWWHYKIRDFPSIILQQGVYAAWLGGQLPAFAGQAQQLQALAAAGGRFWNQRAELRGAFEEYYPWEQGYPPVAFSTLAMMKLTAAGVLAPREVETGARVAAGQLLDRFEHQAANQQVAGLAALAWVRKVFPGLVDNQRFTALKQRSLALQYEEGWFEEYGGPDLGYLAVTIDCLWDIFDATGDEDFVQAARRALDFIHALVTFTGGSPGMHNARNTDYVVPYGIARFLRGNGPEAGKAGQLLSILLAELDAPDHFLNAVDDRYMVHYIGHSCLRAWMELRNHGNNLATAGEIQAATAETHYPRCGYSLIPAGKARLLVSRKKGGIFTLYAGAARHADFGWVVEASGEQFVNHWWSAGWSGEQTPGRIVVRGKLVPHHEHLGTPWKHMALRLASFVFGRRLIGALKGKLIFQEQASPYTFERVITYGTGRVEVRDLIEGLGPDARVRAAPRSSKRHVASADSYQAEDLARTEGLDIQCTTRTADGKFTAETGIALPG